MAAQDGDQKVLYLQCNVVCCFTSVTKLLTTGTVTGGNTLNLFKHFNHVTAVERDPVHFQCSKPLLLGLSAFRRDVRYCNTKWIQYEINIMLMACWLLCWWSSYSLPQYHAALYWLCMCCMLWGEGHGRNNGTGGGDDGHMSIGCAAAAQVCQQLATWQFCTFSQKAAAAW